MFTEVLYPTAKKSLDLLGKSKALSSAYLAGGTALALQLGHRYSYDFDFFTPRQFKVGTKASGIRRVLPNFSLERTAENTILGYIGKTRFSLFFYEYPLLFPPHQFMGVAVADIKDIAPMKITAIADRGITRDFIDLYFICAVAQTISLTEVLRLYDRKYKKFSQNKMHILRSLVYFDDAETSEMPQMIKPVSWNAVKKFFIAEQKKIAKELIGIDL